MEPVIVGALGVVLLLILLGLGVHIGIALLVVGIGGMVAMGIPNVVSFVGSGTFVFTWVFEYVALPLFILMGVFAFRAGIADSAYDALYKWVQRLPGSLAIATTFGCAAFGAVSGSSMATSAVFGKVSLPEMTKHKYAKSLSLGSVAASGTFACMIPPSTLFIIYAIFTEQSIGRLFMAGIIPGLITAVVYAASIVIRVKRNPALAPIPEKEESFSWKEKVASTKGLVPIASLAIVVLGGIFVGLFTVSEGAAVGCVGALAIGLLNQGRAFEIRESLRETAHMTAMVFLIIIGALFFARFLAMSTVPVYLSELLLGLPLPREIVILAIFALFFVLGMLVVPSGIMAMTLPVVFPIVLELGYDPIWFGVIVMKASEIAAVTPPVGLNVYVLKGVFGGAATLEEIFTGIWPFVVCDIVVLGFLIAFPQICLWLPNMMTGG
ncbi:MAG: TRAP transporter large permease [Dehalococcoidales bacterium]|nr:TRAP transporter large permease [Dehalococcoidales bacterium]